MSKKNPRRIPCSLADVEKAKREGAKYALEWAMWSLLENGASTEDVRKFVETFHNLVEHIAAGRISAWDIRSSLEEDFNTEVHFI